MCRVILRSLCLGSLAVLPALISLAQIAPRPLLVVAPSTGIVSSGPQGGPFRPAHFEYRVSASSDAIRYSITAPSWLTVSPSAGTTDTNGVTITFTINETAPRLPPGSYGPAVAFANLSNGRGSTRRVARLTVSALTIRSPAASSGGYLLDDRGRLLDDNGDPLLAR